MNSSVVRNKKAYLQGAYFLCSLFSDGWGGGGGGGREGAVGGRGEVGEG